MDSTNVSLNKWEIEASERPLTSGESIVGIVALVAEVAYRNRCVLFPVVCAPIGCGAPLPTIARPTDVILH